MTNKHLYGKHNGLGKLHYRLRVKKGFMGYRKSIEKAEASGPSENEGMRFECEDGVYEIREGRRCWVEISEVKRAHLELSEGYVN